MLHNVAIIISSDWSEPGYNWDDVWDFCSKLCRLCHSIRKTIRPFCKFVTHHSSESQRAFVADLEWFWYSQGTRKFIISGLFGESAALIFLGLTPYIPLPSVTHHFFHNIQTPSVLCVRDSYPLYCHSPIFHIMHYSMFWTQAPLPLPMPSVHDVLTWIWMWCVAYFLQPEVDGSVISGGPGLLDITDWYPCLLWPPEPGTVRKSLQLLQLWSYS